MRIGVFGGSFDPVHLGHLWIAESAIETLGLDQLRWIPTAKSPLKQDRQAAADETRVAMLRLALGGASQHVVDDREIRRGDVSYTVDTLSELKEEFPDDDLVLIVGSDLVPTLPKWRRLQDILSLADLSVFHRGGEPPIDFGGLEQALGASVVGRLKGSLVEVPRIEVSSSEIRQRIADGKSIRFRVPHAVEVLIRTESLYMRSAET
ncbi:nicotinate (nicotinamide) nucleotide adenylyltransferase [Crateriforma conspicua]|uniref:Probable nicotinate-nucleotide adenylyltransferase n=1 Tax=Crateriforma conspicua TaxID=2527996 RepID=A0A5C5Y7K3_9PLAN|nr:nicotinate (nicotinamide) nucleotide adenylyltransferase [Crateriforma conspicua]TWT70949.1 Nicotinate-nucleotide adenylyltransferase [Crateriforma conspicua]